MEGDQKLVVKGRAHVLEISPTQWEVSSLSGHCLHNLERRGRGGGAYSEARSHAYEDSDKCILNSVEARKIQEVAIRVSHRSLHETSKSDAA